MTSGPTILDHLAALAKLTPEQWAAVEALLADARAEGVKRGRDEPRPWSWYVERLLALRVAQRIRSFIRDLLTPLPWLFPAWLEPSMPSPERPATPVSPPPPPPPPQPATVIASLKSDFGREHRISEVAALAVQQPLHPDHPLFRPRSRLVTKYLDGTMSWQDVDDYYFEVERITKGLGAT